MAIPAEYLRAAKRFGHELDDVAAMYRNPVTGRALSGTALMLKTFKGESGFRKDAVSSAGARGPGQFMPETRKAVLEKSGGKIDPWRSADEAAQAMVMHMTGQLGHAKGLKGYNPGSSSYESYILGQKVGDVGGGRSGSGGGSGAGQTTTTTTPGGTQTVQLPGAPQLDLAGLLSGMQKPAPPQAMGVPAPKFAAGQQFQSLPPSPAPQRSDSSIDVASVLAAAQPPPSTREYQLPGHTTTTTSGNGQVKPPSNKLQAIIQEADSIDRARVPYKWGGGHAGRQARGSKVTPLDCSGAVSRVLGIDPRVSGQFEGWGRPGRAPGGKGVTVYSNQTHVLMEINGRFFGTSGSNPGGGAGWIPREKISKDYLSRFRARHSRRLMA